MALLLQSIIDQELERQVQGRMLIDLSVSGKGSKDPGVSWITLLAVDTYEQIDIPIVTSVRDSLAVMEDAMAHYRLLTTPAVALEFRRKSYVVDQHVGGLNGRSNGSDSPARDIVHHIGRLCVRIAAHMQRQRPYHEHADLYRDIEKATVAVSRATRAKIDFNPRYGVPMKVTDSIADETLAATALYWTFVEGKRSAIITGDSDISRILAAMELHLPLITPVRAALKDRAPRVYFIKNDGSNILKFDSARDDVIMQERLGEHLSPCLEAAQAIADIFGRKNGLYDYIDKHAALYNSGVAGKSASAGKQA
jgi:hypothetical protein